MRSRPAVGALLGLLSAAIALGVGELAAVFVRPEASPIIAVGNRIITLTPGGLKETAIQSAGTNDKLYLIVGIIVLLLIFGAFIGQWAMRRLRYGFVGIGIIGAFGTYCALTADASEGTDVIPILAATAAAAGTLWGLLHLAGGDERSIDEAGEVLTAPDRRRFLQGAAAAAAVAGVTGLGGRIAQDATFSVADERAAVELPAAAEPAEGLPRGADLGKSGVPWATANKDFYRIDRALTVPQIAPDEWQLRVHGMVEQPITLRYDDLLARPLVERWVTLCCVSNEVGGRLVGNALWRGARLADLLREAGASSAADQLLMTGAEGTTIGAPLAAVLDGRHALLAVGMNGAPLPIEHGFPARVVIPGLYGYVSACKWVLDLEVTTFAKEAAYWIQNGWNQEKQIKLAARIDKPSSGASVSKGEMVTIAGVAWDQHVGVSKVEVQVNDGVWQAARLASVPSTDTWRQWVLPWTPQESGAYMIRVRAVDGRGNPQIEQPESPGPGAATGLHAISVQVTA